MSPTQRGRRASNGTRPGGRAPLPCGVFSWTEGAGRAGDPGTPAGPFRTQSPTNRKPVRRRGKGQMCVRWQRWTPGAHTSVHAWPGPNQESSAGLAAPALLHTPSGHVLGVPAGPTGRPPPVTCTL